jgi:hypothetical protein
LRNELQSLLDPAVDAPADLDVAIDSLFVSGRQEPIPSSWSRWDPQRGQQEHEPLLEGRSGMAL